MSSLISQPHILHSTFESIGVMRQQNDAMVPGIAIEGSGGFMNSGITSKMLMS